MSMAPAGRADVPSLYFSAISSMIRRWRDLACWGGVQLGLTRAASVQDFLSLEDKSS